MIRLHRDITTSPLLLGVVLVAGGGAAAQPGTQTNAAADIRARMERAIALLGSDEVDRAVSILLSVVDEVPHHGPARFQLGALAVERSEWQIAVDHLEAAVASYGPEAPSGAVPVQRPGLAWALYSDALGRTGRREEALEATASALRFAPDYLPALLGRSDFARRLAIDAPAGGTEALLETALEAARSARRLAPDRPGPWTALALAAHGAGTPELAECAAGRAAELGPDNPRALFLVAWTSVDSDPEGALTAAEAALAAGLRDEPALWMTLGQLRAFRFAMEAALEAYREALRLDPAVTGEMASLALDAIVAEGDPELLRLLQDRAARRPDALNTRFALAKAALRQGSFERAAQELTRLADRSPDHAAILTTLHGALRRVGDEAAANGVLARLEAVKAADAEAWERANANEERRRRAREAVADGDLGEAVRLWQAVVGGRDETRGDFLEIAADLTELGSALAGLGRHGEALAVFRRSLTLRPFDSATLSAASRVARAVGEEEAAERYAARARLIAADCG